MPVTFHVPVGTNNDIIAGGVTSLTDAKVNKLEIVGLYNQDGNGANYQYTVEPVPGVSGQDQLVLKRETPISW